MRSKSAAGSELLLSCAPLAVPSWFAWLLLPIALLFDSCGWGVSAGFGWVKVKGSSAANSPPNAPAMSRRIFTLYWTMMPRFSRTDCLKWYFENKFAIAKVPKVLRMWWMMPSLCPRASAARPMPTPACLCFWTAMGKGCKSWKVWNRAQPGILRCKIIIFWASLGAEH